MTESVFDLISLATFANVSVASTVIILAFSLLAYILTYNFGVSVVRRFALLLACVVITYTGDVALNRVVSADSANRWLRFQWLGIALMPFAYYYFSLAVLRTTNFRIRWRTWIAISMLGLSILSALSALFGNQIVGQLHFSALVSYLQPGVLFWAFAAYFALAVLLSIHNIWMARQRCLTDDSRKRMTYLLLGFAAPGIGVFPYLIGISMLTGGTGANALIIVLATLGNAAVAFFLVLMSYTVAYFGVLTPDRVVRYRMLRFFTRGPLVAILVIIAMQTVPTVERILGLPRDLILFSTITGIIVLSQLVLSMTKSLVDRAIYREDKDEIGWLRELDRRLLTTTDLRQFLDNNLSALCELMEVRSGFVAAIVGTDLILESLVGSEEMRERITGVKDWSDALNQAVSEGNVLAPLEHADFWIWPLRQPQGENGERGEQAEGEQILGVLGVVARPDAPELSDYEEDVLLQIQERITDALLDRHLQQQVFVSLQRIMPNIERIQQLRSVSPYSTNIDTRSDAGTLLDPSPIHNPEFESWVKNALSDYWGGPRLTDSPLRHLRVVSHKLDQASNDPTKALRLVLGAAIERLKPDGKQDLSKPEWLLYNILDMRFLQQRKVREVANRLATSESDLYRKQRVAIGQVARVLSEMERENGLNGSVAPGSIQAEQLSK